MIHDLLNHTLTSQSKNSQFSLKAYPLFLIASKLLNQKERNSGVILKDACKPYFFLNSIHEKLTPFKRKSNWINTTSDYHLLRLVRFFTRIEQRKESI